MTDKSCCHCKYYQRKQSGPHEWIAWCALQQTDFLNADLCGFYWPGSIIPDNEGERWPFRAESTS
jgi:hypothetical protein